MISKVIHPHERITVRACHTEQFKAGRLSLSIVLPIQKTAYMTALLFSVLLRGTEDYPSVSALNRRLDYLYGAELSMRNSYRGDCHVVGFSVDFLSDEYIKDGAEALLPALCELMAQILYRPVLDADGLLGARYVESEKLLQCDAIRAQKNSPSSYSVQRLNAMLYENEPFGIARLGTVEQVLAVTPEELTAHWRALSESLSLELFYVGSADAGKLARTVTDAFEKYLPTHGRPALPSPFGGDYTARICREGEEILPIKQGHLAIGLRAPRATIRDDAFYACVLFNELLGASPVSKLFMNVREKLSLCYSCSSAYNAYKGTVVIGCGLENENRDVAQREILRQIRDVANGDFTDEEWLAAQKSLENAYRQMSDSPRALENFYYGRMLAGVDADLDESLARFSRVSREDVMAVAALFSVDSVFFLRADPSRLNDGEEGYDEED